MLTAEHILVYVEPLLVLAVLIIFLKTGFARRLPAMRNYLVFRVGSAFLLNEVLLQLQHFVPVSATRQCAIYFFAYWSLYLVGAVLIFFVLREVFSILMQPVPQVRKLGMMAFHWAVAISGIVAVIIVASAGFSPKYTFAGRLVYATKMAMNSVSVLELCLLAFVALTIHSLGRSFRSPLFGVALGFGIQAAAEFIIIGYERWHQSGVWSSANFFLEASIVMVFFTWGAYFLLPEKVPAAQVQQFVPTPSPLIRWNDVAQALGHSSPRVAAGASTGFFLQDVEKVVDRVLAKNRVPEVKSSNSSVG
jgi:hypothetical protein